MEPQRILQWVSIILLTLADINGYRVHPTESKYGITIETLDAPVFYNTFVPIIYEFKLPEWTSSDMKMRWPSWNNQCDRSDARNWTWDGQACPVVNHYNLLLESVLKNLSDWKDLTLTGNTSLRTNWPLNEIVPHFKGQKVNETELDGYIKYFGRFPFSKPIVHKSIPYYNDLNVDEYDKLLTNFHETSVKRIAREESFTKNSSFLFTQHALLTNSFTGIQTLNILNFYMVRNEWVDSLHSFCMRSKIPPYLVKNYMLSQTLVKVRQQLSQYHKVNYDLSISMDELNEYYNLPLTDCTFTSGNNFIVRVLVPIRKVGSKEILLKVNSIPFIRKEGDRTELCQLANMEGRYISRDETMNLLQVDHCDPNSICKVPTRSEWSVANACFTAIVTNSQVDIRRFCSMECLTYMEANGPYFKQIAADKYAVAGGFSKPEKEDFVLFSCTRNLHDRMVKVKSYGAVIVTLPCSCSLVYELDVLTINGPCNETFEAPLDQLVTPFLWNKEDDWATTEVATWQTTALTSTEIGEDNSTNEETEDSIHYHEVTFLLLFMMSIVFVYFGIIKVCKVNFYDETNNPDIDTVTRHVPNSDNVIIGVAYGDDVMVSIC